MPDGETWVLEPGEYQIPEGLSGQDYLKQLELSIRGITKKQFQHLLERRKAQTPEDIMREYRAKAKRYVALGLAKSVEQYINSELGDVVAIRDLKLPSDLAHNISNKFTGYKRQGGGLQSWYEQGLLQQKEPIKERDMPDGREWGDPAHPWRRWWTGRTN